MEWVSKFVVLLLGGYVAVTLLLVAYKLSRSNNYEYEKNRQCSGSGKLLNPLRGTVATVFDGGRDFRVKAGLAVNRNNQWVEQGALSEEAVDSVLR